jgi:sulfite exporter TauE/SafE/copper chaperone CopZ
MKNEIIKVSGMSCANCELKIENVLSKIDGVSKVKARYDNSTVEVEYDENKTNINYIKMKIALLDYKADETNDKKTDLSNVLYVLIIIVGIYIILNHFGLLSIFNVFPQADASMGYGLLFGVGLLTSVHCVSMCGGINLTQSIKGSKENSSNKENFITNMQYNLGRVISYTVIGGLVGLLGSVISFNGFAKGIVAIIAGLVMIIMGLNMLDVLPFLKKINIHMPKFITKKLSKHSHRSSFYIGLINGFMPCGPLQSMQILALSTASFINGALSMFFFALGTVPLMFILGFLSSYLNKKFMKGMLSVSACLVILFGITMFSSGSAQSGLLVPKLLGDNLPLRNAQVIDDKQYVETNVYRNGYEPIKVKKDIPVVWTIHVDKGSLNGCNNPIVIPKYDLEVKLIEGDNVVEFTPTTSGTITFSCWMGMIRSSITVIE